MTYGTEIQGVRRTRAWTGESGAGFAKTAAVRESEVPVEAKASKVSVEATLGRRGYTLTVTAEGQSATVEDVHPAELAERIARLIQAVTKAARKGELTKSSQRDSSPFVMGRPTSGRDNLTR